MAIHLAFLVNAPKQESKWLVYRAITKECNCRAAEKDETNAENLKWVSRRIEPHDRTRRMVYCPLMQDEPSRVGLCLDCNYMLQGITSTRCPECGRAFDPNDPKTMNMGKPMGWLARVILSQTGNQTLLALHTLGVVAMMWGLAWLPGALVVLFIGVVTLMATYALRSIRGLARIWARAHYCQPTIRPRYSRRVQPALILGTAGVLMALDIPLWCSVHLAKLIATPKLHRIYAVEPAYLQIAAPGWVGPFYAQSIEVLPTGVYIHVYMGGLVLYQEDPARWTTQFLDTTHQW